jgi:hypothetical protein
MGTTYAEMSNVMDWLIGHRAPALPADALAEVFDRMIWCLDDNGGALLQVREQWLVSEDRDRVEIALAMQETFPFQEAAKMNEVFARISAKWPELAASCEAIRQARERTGA